MYFHYYRTFFASCYTFYLVPPKAVPIKINTLEDKPIALCSVLVNGNTKELDMLFGDSIKQWDEYYEGYKSNDVSQSISGTIPPGTVMISFYTGREFGKGVVEIGDETFSIDGGGDSECDGSIITEQAIIEDGNHNGYMAAFSVIFIISALLFGTIMLVPILKAGNAEYREDPALHLQKGVIIPAMLIIVVSEAIILSKAGAASLWYDDFKSIEYVGMGPYRLSLFDTIRTGIFVEKDIWSNPPFFYYVASIWLRIIPYGTFWVELLNILLTMGGSIALCMLTCLYDKGRSLVINTVIIFSSSLLITAGTHTLRCYGVLFFLSGMILLSWYLICEHKDYRWIGMLSVLLVMLCYTHFYAFFYVAGLGVAALIRTVRQKEIRILMPFVITGVLTMPLLMIFHLAHLQWKPDTIWISSPSVMDMISVFKNLFDNNEMLLFTFLLFCGSLMGSHCKEGKGNDVRKWFMVDCICVFLFVFGGTALFSIAFPNRAVFGPARYMIIVLPIIMMFESGGIISLIELVNDKRIKQAIVFSLSVSLLLGFYVKVAQDAFGNNELYEEVVEWIYDHKESHFDDAVSVVVEGGDYYNHHNYSRKPIRMNSRFIEEIHDYDIRSIYCFPNLYDYVFISERHGNAPSEIWDVLNEEYVLVDSNEDLSVYEYKRKVL